MIFFVFNIVILFGVILVISRRLWVMEYGKLLTGGLLIKVFAGICLGLVYKYYYEGEGDTFTYFNEAGKIVDYITFHPSHLWKVFADTQTTPLFQHLNFNDEPRALFFVKIVTPFYFITGGNYWLTSIYFSVIDFVGIFYLVKAFYTKYKSLRVPSIFAFLYLPGFVFWTSGVMKESIAIAALSFLVGSVILIREKKSNFSVLVNLATILLSFYFLWQLKYFYAAVLIPVIIVYSVVETFRSKSIFKQARFTISIWLGLFSIIVVLFSTLHYNLHLSNVLRVIFDNYTYSVQASDKGDAITYTMLDGTLLSFVMNAPWAIISGFFRPFAFEVSNIWQGAMAAENLMVMIFAITGFFKFRKMKIIDLNGLFSISVYIFMLNLFLAFASPNFGTLSRYKVGYWPFFVMLLLTVLFNKKAPDKARSFSD